MEPKTQGSWFEKLEAAYTETLRQLETLDTTIATYQQQRAHTARDLYEMRQALAIFDPKYGGQVPLNGLATQYGETAPPPPYVEVAARLYGRDLAPEIDAESPGEPVSVTLRRRPSPTFKTQHFWTKNEEAFLLETVSKWSNQSTWNPAWKQIAEVIKVTPRAAFYRFRELQNALPDGDPRKKFTGKRSTSGNSIHRWTDAETTFCIDAITEYPEFPKYGDPIWKTLGEVIGVSPGAVAVRVKKHLLGIGK